MLPGESSSADERLQKARDRIGFAVSCQAPAASRTWIAGRIVIDQDNKRRVRVNSDEKLDDLSMVESSKVNGHENSVR